MSDALTAYRDTQRELDKFESPTFTVGDFNYFYPSSIDEYITNNYAVFDVTQKSLDDISAIVALGASLTFTNNEASLPDKYRHILYLETELKFLEDVDGYAKDSTLVVKPQRLRTNRKGFVSKNAYQQPSYKQPYFQIAKGVITLLANDKVEFTTGKIDFIEIPENVYLNPDPASDHTNPLNNTPLQFPQHVNFEIVKHCRKIFLENIESPRYQSSLQESTLRQE